MSEPRHPVEWLNSYVARFRDDDRDGWEMRLTRGNDGDFWISVVPDWRDMTEPDDRELYSPAFRSGLRVRMPMVGGGSHQALYDALCKLWNEIEASAPAEEDMNAKAEERAGGDPDQRPDAAAE